MTAKDTQCRIHAVTGLDARTNLLGTLHNIATFNFHLLFNQFTAILGIYQTLVVVLAIGFTDIVRLDHIIVEAGHCHGRITANHTGTEEQIGQIMATGQSSIRSVDQHIGHQETL